MQAVMRAGLRYLPLVLLAVAWEAQSTLVLAGTVEIVSVMQGEDGVNEGP